MCSQDLSVTDCVSKAVPIDPFDCGARQRHRGVTAGVGGAAELTA